MAFIIDPYLGYDWRFVVALPSNLADPSISGTVLSTLEGVATNRAIAFALNQPAVLTADLLSDDAEVNTVYSSEPVLTDGHLIFGFRRDGAVGDPPWRVRFAGIAEILQDAANPGDDSPNTSLTAYDVWRYLYSVPIFNDDLSLPGPDGRTFTGDAYPTVADVLVAAFSAAEAVLGTDLYFDYGQTAFYTGILDETVLNPTINCAAGSSIGDLLDQVTQAPYVDIVFSPIYDPINRPGLINEISVFAEAGITNYDAVMAWDMPGHSLSGIDQTHDLSKAAQVVQFFNGPGGPPVTRQTDPPAIVALGGHQYWYQQFFTVPSQNAIVETLARAELLQRRLGHGTITITPAPSYAPLPLVDYSLGDSVPIWASDRLRRPIAGFYRFYTIPFKIDDDGTETVEQALMTVGLV